MLSLQVWMLKSSLALCLVGLILASCMTAHAQFNPTNEITVSTWEEPTGGFNRYWWLNDDELVYTRNQNSNYQFVKRNLMAGTEQELSDLTKDVSGSESNWYGYLYPSPDGKYLAWLTGPALYTNDYTLMIATMEGSVITKYSSKKSLGYPSWTDNSQACLFFTSDFGPVSFRISSGETWEWTQKCSVQSLP